MIYKAKARESITVSTTVKTLTASNIDTNTVYALLQVQTAQIRLTLNGTDPVASTTGFILYPGDFKEIWGDFNMKNAKMIREGSTDAVVEVHYMRAV